MELLRIFGTEYKEMTKALLEEANLISMIPSQDSMVGIKPNLVAPSPAMFGATTHPEIVAGIIEYLKEHGHSKIIIAEGSWVGDKTSEAYEVCGYKSLCEAYDVPFFDTQKDSSHEVDCAGINLKICDVVDTIDFMINVPVLKGHCQTNVTCALKNMKGLIPNTEKRHFHTMGLHKPIAHLSVGIHQDFIVVDHICGDLDFEEGGNPVTTNCIMAATDPVMVDALACDIVGVELEDVPYISMAQSLGSGSADLSQLVIKTLPGINDDNQSISSKPYTKDIACGIRDRKILKVAYSVDEVDSCSACYANLIPALLRLEEEGLLNNLNDKISIGQGHQGQGGKIGVGRCTANHDFCIMGCPPDEDKIYEELKTYLTTR